ncbi:hypothetical protein MBANPS3_008346 [Mucor bainieri]
MIAQSSAPTEPSSVPPKTDGVAQNQVSPASIWKDWIAYAHSNLDEFHPFSLIANDVVRAGKGVLGKPDLDESLYAKHMQIKTTALYPMLETFKEYIMAFTTAQDEIGCERVVNSISMMLFEQKEAGFEFLRNILEEICIQSTFRLATPHPHGKNDSSIKHSQKRISYGTADTQQHDETDESCWTLYRSHLAKISTLKSYEEIDRLDSGSFATQKDLYVATSCLKIVMNSSRNGFFRRSKILENDILLNIWVIVDQMINAYHLEVKRSEPCSAASSARRNRDRTADEMKRKKIGRKNDLIICSSTGIELGCGEAELETEEYDTKVMMETNLKTPKIRHDMLVRLCKSVDNKQEIVREVQVVGLVFSRFQVRMLTMDCPKGYACRLRSTTEAAFSGDEASLGNEFSKVYSLLWMAKEVCRATENVVKLTLASPPSVFLFPLSGLQIEPAFAVLRCLVRKIGFCYRATLEVKYDDLDKGIVIHKASKCVICMVCQQGVPIESVVNHLGEHHNFATYCAQTNFDSSTFISKLRLLGALDSGDMGLYMVPSTKLLPFVTALKVYDGFQCSICPDRRHVQAYYAASKKTMESHFWTAHPGISLANNPCSPRKVQRFYDRYSSKLIHFGVDVRSISSSAGPSSGGFQHFQRLLSHVGGVEVY